MATSIHTNRPHSRGYVWKQWSRWLAIVGVGVEVIILVLRFTIGTRSGEVLLYFIIPLVGIITGIVFLVIWHIYERSPTQERVVPLVVQQYPDKVNVQPFSVLNQVDEATLFDLAKVNEHILLKPEKVNEQHLPDTNQLLKILNRPYNFPIIRQQMQPPFSKQGIQHPYFIVPLEGGNPDECADKG